MSAVRINKEQIEEALRARQVQLETDPTFRESEEERERVIQEEIKRLRKEGEA